MSNTSARGRLPALGDDAPSSLRDRKLVGYHGLCSQSVPMLTEELEGRYREALGAAEMPRATVLQIHHFMTSLVHAATKMLAAHDEKPPVERGKDLCPTRPAPKPEMSQSRRLPKVP